MKSYFKILAIAVVVFALLAPISCDNSSDEEIPYNVVKATAMMFEFVGMIFEAEDVTTYFTAMGMTVVLDGDFKTGAFPCTITITGSNIDPDPNGEESDILIKTFSFKIIMDDEPYSMQIDWTATLENWLYNTVSLNANFGWLGSNSPETGPPDTYTGTITVDGKAYSIADVINAAGWEELIPDNNEEEPI